MCRRFVLALVVSLTIGLAACSIVPSPISTPGLQTGAPLQPSTPASSPSATLPGDVVAGGPTVAVEFTCPITPISTGPTPYGGQVPPVVGWYANESLWVGLTGEGPWRPADNKVAWWRKIPGNLVIEGRRLDAPAPPLRADVSSGYYGPAGFQPSSIAFPSAGCWEVTGYLVAVKAGSQYRTGDELRFVVRVE